MNTYILDAEGNPQRETDIRKWGEWFEKAERHVGNDRLPNGARVSTVFLGLDHAWDGPEPVLWETMIFGGEHDEYQERYTSREDAIAGHKKAVALAGGPA